MIEQRIKIDRKHVKTLMTQMGIEAIYCEPNTVMQTGHAIFPYLLRGMGIGYDLYFHGQGVCLSGAVVDLTSRKILAANLTVTLEAWRAG